MPEEEASFTFVDKRHAVAEPEPVIEEPVVEEQGEEAFDGGAARPDVYGLLGYCLSLLSAEAWHKLGLLADPQTGQAQADLPQAKVAIDAVGDLAARLEAAPEASVPASMRRELKTLLNDLRLNYVAQRDQPTAPQSIISPP